LFIRRIIMPVYVYDDYTKSKCICVLDDDGRVYDKPDSPYNSTPRQVLGNVDYNYRVFYGKDRYDEAGAADHAGYVYNDMDNMYSANRVGFVEDNKVYEDGPSVSGYSPMSSPIAYMEGDGDMKSAGAAALLLVLGKGGRPSSRSHSSGSSSSSSYSGSSSSGSGYSGSSRSNSGSRSSTPSNSKRAPIGVDELGGWLILIAIVLFVLEKLFG
jgi:uncharacterized membrane protein YgcG